MAKKPIITTAGRRFSLHFDCDNAVFDGFGGGLHAAIPGTLQTLMLLVPDVTNNFSKGHFDGKVLDVNGNSIGEWRLENVKRKRPKRNWRRDPGARPDTPALDTSFHDHEMDV